MEGLWSSVDWVVLLAYFPLVGIIGFLFATIASKSMKSFFLSNRAFTIPILIGTGFASWYDSWTIVGQAAAAWEMGVALCFAYLLPNALLRLPLAYWIAPLVSDKIPDDVYTLPDLIEHLYDKRSGLISVALSVTDIVYSGALALIVAQVIHMITGFPTIWMVALVAGCVALYTSLAGLWGVAISDIIQFVIMMVAGGTLGFALLSYRGGIDSTVRILLSEDPALLSPLGHENWASILAWVVAALALYTSPQAYQRFMAARSGNQARVAYSIVLWLGLIFGCIMVFAGLVARAHFPDLPAEQGFWTVALSCMGPGLRGLFVAGLAAAAMSTTDTDLLVASTVLVKNVYRDLINPRLTELQVVRANRTLIPILLFFVVLASLLFQEGIDKAWYYIGGFQTACFFVPLVAGLFYSRKTPQGGFIALASAIVFYVVWEFVLGAPFEIPSNTATWIFSVIVYFVACNLTYRKSQSEETGVSTP